MVTLNEYKNEKGFAHILLLVLIVVGGYFVFNYLKNNTSYLDKLSKEPTVNTYPKATIVENKLVENFPDFPIFEKATLTSSQYIESIDTPYYQAPSYQVYMDVNDGVHLEEAMDWYIAEFKKQGWTIDLMPEDPAGEDQSIFVSKGALKATVNIEEEDAHTVVAIHIQDGGQK